MLINMVKNIRKLCKEKLNSLICDGYKFIYLETVSACPVKCIPCPVGRNTIPQHSTVVLDLAIARKCFYKLVSEFKVTTLIMGNWGEPLLHPRFVDLVGFARAAGFKQIGVSTSLSVKTDISALASCGLDFIAVSVSGLTKDVYNQSHRRGNFDLVMRNLEDLAASITKQRMRTKLNIRWHRYHHNEFQLDDLKEFCEQLGIGYNAYYGHLGSIESLIDWKNNTLEEPLRGFAVKSVFTKFLEQACELNKNAIRCRQSEFLVVDADATLVFCCSCYKYYKNSLDFLSCTPADVRRFKQPDSSICPSCLENGWAGYMNRPKTLEEYGINIEL